MKRTSTRALAVGVTAAVIALSACGDDGNDSTDTTTAATEAESDDGATASGTIVDVALEAGTFNTLVAAVTAAGLAETLSGEGPFTVFAPDDDAFAALPVEVLDALLLPENQGTLADILTYHVVSGEVFAADITDGDVTTVEGQDVTLATEGGVTVNGVSVVTPDITASNGVIHVIDGVLLPPDVDLDALLGSDMSEDEMSEDEMSEDETVAEATDQGTVVDVALGAGQFTTLVAALEAAELVDDLSGEGPFTVFAPNDDAFAALPVEVIEALLLPENQEVLAQILAYHVVVAEVLSTDIEAGDVETFEGSTVAIGVDDGTVTVNDATVIAADVTADNGVIHVIDSVLLPPDVDVSALLG
ncbi:MAG: fasciclin domain-containing protein [Actinomycetota bacterium]